MQNHLKIIINQFQITGKVLSITPIEIGHINHTYKIKTDRANYVLQRINTVVFQQPMQIMENICKVGNYLKANNYPKEILFPIQTIDHQYVVVTSKKAYWRLFPFIENTITYNSVDSEDKAYAAAFSFGEYASYLADFKVEELYYTIPDFHNTNLRYQQFLHAAKKATRELKKQAHTSIDELHQFQYLLTDLQKLKIPLRVVHSDTKINNILFDKTSKQPVCVIDLDTLMPGNILYDYGDMVRTFTPIHDENSDQYDELTIRKNILKALTEGYLAGLNACLLKEEEAALNYGAQLIIFEQALRFLTDYLNGNVYYKVADEHQNLVRAKNQICLLKDLIRVSV